MAVSVVIPARNAAETLGETLDSLVSQTRSDWEAIVVDDHSIDHTSTLAAGYAAADGRITIVEGAGAGVSVARNRGVEHARFDYLLFLDADDLIEAEHLERLENALQGSPAAVAACSAWARLTPDRRVVSRTAPRRSGDLFGLLGRHSVFPIHACLVRKDIVIELGGFDSGLTTCEDWDLWQRVARTGGRFLAADGALALYRMRASSATANPRRFLQDGLEVIDRGHSPDHRVPSALAAHAHGLPRDDLSAVRFRFAAWVCSLAVGCGEDVVELLEPLRDEAYPHLEIAVVADSVLEAVALPRCLPPEDWPDLWPRVRQPVRAMLDALEAASAAGGLRRAVERAIEQRIAALEVGSRSTLGPAVQRVEIDTEHPLEEITPPAGTERVACSVTYGGTRLGMLELPVCDGSVCGSVIADAVAGKWAWTLLGLFFASNVYPSLVRRQEDGVWRVERGSVVLEQETRETEPADTEFHDKVGWSVLLQEAWGQPDWPVERFYDPLAELAADVVDRPASGAPMVVDIASDPVSVRCDGELTLAVAAGHTRLGVVTVRSSEGVVSASAIRAAVTTQLGFELVRAVAVGALIGHARFDRSPLRARLAIGRPETGSSSEEPGVLWLERRRPFTFGTSDSRSAALPSSAAAHLLRAAGASGETASGVYDHPSEIRRVLYAPDRIPRVVPGGSGGPAPGGAEADDDHVSVDRRHVERLSASGPERWFHRIQRSRREGRLRGLRRGGSEVTATLQPIEVPDRVEASIRSTGAATAPDAPEPIVTERLPILMYHRIADGGSPQSARYRVAPEAFEEQLAYLREAGYRSVTSREWQEAMLRRRPLPGRRVLLTFDDAYEDFLEEAWPRLKRHGFGATLFVVTDRGRDTAEWDRALGDEARLLDWTQLERLAGEGVEIGSHSASHSRLTALSTRGVVEEAARSRATIAERLGIVPEDFAYPYGDHDEVVEHLIGACGYTRGLTTRSDYARLADPLLALPRIEISGSMDSRGFVESLEEVSGGARTTDGGAMTPVDQPSLSYDPELVPPLALMRTEGIDVLEEWYRWAEEWSVLLRVYGRLTERSKVLEIGCGLGRVAFALRYLLTPGGTYDGFEIVAEKVEFLERSFAPLFPNFRFRHADVHNTYYNPAGTTPPAEYRFPYADGSFDLVYAASVFTHALPEVVRRYFAETARVLAPNGRAVFSFFLLDHYRLAGDRPSGFSHGRFDLEHAYGGDGGDFRIANPGNPEEMTGFRLSLVKALAADAGLAVRQVVPGRWSGSFPVWISTQDLVVLERAI